MERHKIEPHKKTIFTKQFFIYLAKEYGLYNPQIEMFVHFKTKSSFHKTKCII